MHQIADYDESEDVATMFTLTINNPNCSSMASHPSREVALDQLHQFLTQTGQRLRVLSATWTHARYEILQRTDDVVGHAAIDELCVCTHPARDHEETGCTAISFDPGPFAECSCAAHRPGCADPGLFALDVPT